MSRVKCYTEYRSTFPIYFIFQVELKMNNSVKYIDIKEGSSLAYVRCDTAEAAQTFAQKSGEERHMTLLEGKSIQYTSVSQRISTFNATPCRRRREGVLGQNRAR